MARGQVTPFMIIGVLLFFLFVIVLSNQDVVNQSAPPLSPAPNVQWYVESCLQKTAADTLFQNGRRGGYFLLPQQATISLAENVPYYKQGDILLVPDDQSIAR